MKIENAKEMHKTVLETIRCLPSDDERRSILKSIDDKLVEQMFFDICNDLNICPICGGEKQLRSIRTYESYRTPNLVIDVPFEGCETEECAYNEQMGDEAERAYRKADDYRRGKYY